MLVSDNFLKQLPLFPIFGAPKSAICINTICVNLKNIFCLANLITIIESIFVPILVKTLNYRNVAEINFSKAFVASSTFNDTFFTVTSFLDIIPAQNTMQSYPNL